MLMLPQVIWLQGLFKRITIGNIWENSPIRELSRNTVCHVYLVLFPEWSKSRVPLFIIGCPLLFSCCKLPFQAHLELHPSLLLCCNSLSSLHISILSILLRDSGGSSPQRIPAEFPTVFGQWETAEKYQSQSTGGWGHYSLSRLSLPGCAGNGIISLWKAKTPVRWPSSTAIHFSRFCSPCLFLS